MWTIDRNTTFSFLQEQTQKHLSNPPVEESADETAEVMCWWGGEEY